MHSGELLEGMNRLHRTGHTSRLPALLVEHGLQVDVKPTFHNIGLKTDHPVLSISNYITALSDAGKLDILFQGHDFTSYLSFWARYKRIKPTHPVFDVFGQDLSHCVPCFLHADEGTSQKKRQILVLQLQPVMGKGSSRSAELNFCGSTYLTRILWSVMQARLYAKSKLPLYALLQVLAQECTDAFNNGLDITLNQRTHRIRLVVLGLKGDWPALTKLGRLTRHHLRDAPKAENPPGICHLCLAGQSLFPWHVCSPDAAWLETIGADPLPWTIPSPLANIPQDKSDRASFYLIDLFHTVHKGVFCDIAGSAIVS